METIRPQKGETMIFKGAALLCAGDSKKGNPLFEDNKIKIEVSMSDLRQFTGSSIWYLPGRVENSKKQ